MELNWLSIGIGGGVICIVIGLVATSLKHGARGEFDEFPVDVPESYKGDEK